MSKNHTSSPGVATERVLQPSDVQARLDRIYEVAQAPVDWNKVLREQAKVLWKIFGE